MPDFSSMSLAELLNPEGFPCACGLHHSTQLKAVHSGHGAVAKLPEALKQAGISRPFIFCDVNTRAAAWAQAQAVLEAAGIPYQLYCFAAPPEPDEHACGSLLMAFDPACDGVLVIGSGVLNDIGKVLAHALRLPQVVLATAPSMDGYASDSSSMVQAGVKVTLYNACPQVIVADMDILCAAPEILLQAGLGDMLAKYLSLLEWRLSHLVTGEYYCENIAGLMRRALHRVVDNGPKLLSRDPAAVESIFEGLTLSGVAMSYAKVSRPASGLEHYFSHLWEMMALQRHQPQHLHGIQVGVGTLLTLKLWEQLVHIEPSRERGLAFRASFDEAAWAARIRKVFGSTAQALLDAAAAQGRNDESKHRERLDRIVQHWPEILRMAQEELPGYQAVYDLMKSQAMPLLPEDLGFSEQDTLDAFFGSREIRDKYLTSSLLWDLGLMYNEAELWLKDEGRDHEI